MNFPRRFVELSGSVMSVIDVGSGPALYLGHGWLCDATMWSEQISALSRQYRVIAPDMWGHGLSAALPTGTDSMIDLARQHLAVLDGLEVKKAALIGVSLGGMWAGELALLAPERVSALVLMATSLAAEPAASRDAYMAAVNIIGDTGNIPPDLADNLVSLFYSEVFRSSAPRVVDAHRGRLEGWRADRLRDSVAPIGHFIFHRRDALADLKTLEMPILCMAGTDDRALDPASVALMAEAIGGRFLSLAHVGHLLPQEAGSDVNALLADFVR